MFKEYELMIKAGAVILVLVAAFSSGWKVRDWKADADEKKAIEKALEDYKAALVVSAEIETRTIELKTEVEYTYEEIKKDAVTIDTCSNDFLQLFNESAKTFNAYASGGTNEARPSSD